jgi:hypothetical protein
MSSSFENVVYVLPTIGWKADGLSAPKGNQQQLL